MNSFNSSSIVERSAIFRRLGMALCAATFLIPVNPVLAQQPLQTLHNHVRHAIEDGEARQVGRLPSTQRLNLTITLPLRNGTELGSLLGRLYDPSSPDYRRFLSVAQFTERFGPTAQDFQAVHPAPSIQPQLRQADPP